jgi:hypothetical protein
MFKLNKYPFGILIGTLAPIFGFIIYYFYYSKVNPYDQSFFQFLSFFFKQRALLTSVGSLCLIANIILFTLYINSRKDKTAIGIFVMTVMYGMMILYAKFFL